MTILYKRGLSKWPFKMSRFSSLERRLPPVLALLRGPNQQSQSYGATQTRPWSAIAKHPATIPMAQRHPRDPPGSNPHDTTPHTRRTRDTDPHGTAAPTRNNPHSPAPHTAHARRARNANPHGTELTTHRATPRPSGHTANEANASPTPRPPNYKRKPFTTHSEIKIITKII